MMCPPSPSESYEGLVSRTNPSSARFQRRLSVAARKLADRTESKTDTATVSGKVTIKGKSRRRHRRRHAAEPAGPVRVHLQSQD